VPFRSSSRPFSVRSLPSRIVTIGVVCASLYAAALGAGAVAQEETSTPAPTVAAETATPEVIILGWEPGGGSEPECQTSDPPVDKSAFFYDADTGAKLGQWTLPRGQDGPSENCTIHNYNIVPLANGRDVMVGGHYQAGTWVVDFTNPANAQTVGWSDPPVLDPPDLGGAWSSYRYNGFLWESEITKGLNVFRLNDRATRSALKLRHLNPQTQEFSLRGRGHGHGDDDSDDDSDSDD
jgi:hypothetical protein